jgi:hypothetical protein
VGDREIQVAARRRVDDSAAHELVAEWRYGCRGSPEQVRDRTDLLGAVGKVRQRGDVEALGAGQLADPLLVELRVEFGFDYSDAADGERKT